MLWKFHILIILTSGLTPQFIICTLYVVNTTFVTLNLIHHSTSDDISNINGTSDDIKWHIRLWVHIVIYYMLWYEKLVCTYITRLPVRTKTSFYLHWVISTCITLATIQSTGIFNYLYELIYHGNKICTVNFCES